MDLLSQRIFLIGIMGAGKSYWAKKLSGYFNAPLFDTDGLIEESAGVNISQIFLREDGASQFREMERELLGKTTWPAGAIISCGGGLPCYFDNMEYMLQEGIVVWLNPSPVIIAERLWEERSHRPLVAACNTMNALQERIMNLLQEREPFYSRAHIEISVNTEFENLAEKITRFQKTKA